MLDSGKSTERMRSQQMIPTTLSAAARMKYAEELPVILFINGKAFALANAPILPSIFIAPEKLPVRLPAISAQKTQLGLIVRSAPKMAIVKARTAVPTEWDWVTAMSPAAASANPTIEGNRRDHDRREERYIRSTSVPAMPCDVAPSKRGAIAYRAAWEFDR